MFQDKDLSGLIGQWSSTPDVQQVIHDVLQEEECNADNDVGGECEKKYEKV